MAQEAHQGRLVGGRYRLVKTLHTGGFGRVWQARDECRQEDVAVKEVWLPPGLSDAERTDRVVRADREARNAAQLRNHPNIVAVRDVVTEDGVPWIVMRLVTGHSLAQDIAASGPLSAEQVAYVADSLLKALGAAHEAGIVHRDVKPANVMFTETGEVLLTDFGIAVHAADTTLTATGMLVGSVEYMAPERIHGRDSNAAGDMFSLGVTLYQAVTGTSPFHRDTAAVSFAALLFVDPPPPRCEPGLQSLIMRLLAKDPAGRPTVPVARGLLAALPTGRRTKAQPVATAVATRQASAPVAAPKRPTPTRVDPAPPVSTPPVSTPPRRPQWRLASTPRPAKTARPVSTPRVVSTPRPVAMAPRQAGMRRQAGTPWPVSAPRPTWRRRRHRSGVSVIVLIALGFVGAHVAWGRDAAGATTGDCVYNVQRGWHLEPCALPPPWRTTADYKVIDRVVGTRADCAAIPDWTPGDTAVVLRGVPPVTLCLAPVR